MEIKQTELSCHESRCQFAGDAATDSGEFMTSRIKKFSKFYRFLFGFIFALGSCGITPDVSRADVEYRCIRSIEWLIDNSDVIVIARYKSADDDSPEIVHSFKGKEADVLFPLARFETWEIKTLDPSSNGLNRVLFIRGNSQLLSQIDIVRSSKNQPIGWAYKMVYGITQYGNAIMTEGELFTAIQNRVSKPPKSKDLGSLRTAFLHESDLPGAFVGGPPGFFLNHDDWWFFVEVPFNEERRNYFLELAKSSVHPREIIWAIDELRYFEDDGTAKSAIEEIVKDRSRKLVPAFRSGKSDTITLLNVREHAWKALHGAKSKLEE